MEVVVFVGLQAGGKSTLYRARYADTHAHVSKDHFRNNRNPNRRQLLLIAEALAAGRSVVVDNTNPTPADRAPVIGLARLSRAWVVGVWFDATLDECLERNARRTGKDRVPDIGLRAVAARLQRPTFAEGFDELLVAQLAPNGVAVGPLVPEPTDEDR